MKIKKGELFISLQYIFGLMIKLNLHNMIVIINICTKSSTLIYIISISIDSIRALNVLHFNISHSVIHLLWLQHSNLSYQALSNVVFIIIVNKLIWKHIGQFKTYNIIFLSVQLLSIHQIAQLFNLASSYIYVLQI